MPNETNSMKPLDFNQHKAFKRYQVFFEDTFDYHTDLPSTTTEDFWKDAQNWLTLNLISIDNQTLKLNKSNDNHFGNTFKCLDGKW